MPSKRPFPIFSFQKLSQKGFTLLEVLVVVAIIGTLAGIVMISVNRARLKARDAKRLSDMEQIQTALEMYYNKYGQYPDGACDPLGDCVNLICGGWDTQGDGEFLKVLNTEGFLSTKLADPKTTPGQACGGQYQYRYFRYNPYHAAAYCDPCNGKYYYVLGFTTSESVSGKNLQSPGWSCSARDWQPEASWITGRCE